MPFTDTWDVTTPPDTQLANQLGLDLRNLKLDIQQRMGAISGLSSALPPFGSDAQPANWTGLLFFATDTGQVFQWNGTTWVDTTIAFLPTMYYSDPTTPTVTATGVINSVTIPAAALADGKQIHSVSSIQGVGASGANVTYEVNGIGVAVATLTGTPAYVTFVLDAMTVGGYVVGALTMTAIRATLSANNLLFTPAFPVGSSNVFSTNLTVAAGSVIGKALSVTVNA
jgi:hypothetical protein